MSEPTVIQLRYMAELLGVDVNIGGPRYAGSYDPKISLGRLIGDKSGTFMQNNPRMNVMMITFLQVSSIDPVCRKFRH